MNWLLKQIFYLRYLVLKQGGENYPMGVLYDPNYVPKSTFLSHSFTDGQWNKYLEWYLEDKTFQDWNTIKYTKHLSEVPEFKQLYGKWYFKAKLNGLVTKTSWPAIWLLELNNEPGKTWYFEIDIELFRENFGITVWSNPNGPQETAKVVRSKFANHKFYRKLQSDYHLFMIDWNKEWIKFSINGLLCARFKNEIHIPMQIICSKLSMNKIIVKKIQ